MVERIFKTTIQPPENQVSDSREILFVREPC